MPKQNFQVAIMHGHSRDYLKVKDYIIESGFSQRVLIEEYSADTIFENFRNLIWDDIHCVIVILTKDDEMLNGSMRARQNVVFELGYCFGAFDSLPNAASYKPSDALIILSEKGVEIFADIDGLTRIEYEPGLIESKKEFIVNCLAKSHAKAKRYYILDNL
jgi:predicted nucleotide-binding protein